MSFKSYASETCADGSLLLTEAQPLVFSGRHGLIAKFVLSEQERAGRPWRLCPGEIHALAFVAALAHERIIVFEETEAQARSLMELTEIAGISDACTEMLFSFSPLEIVCQNPLRVRAQAVSRSYGEDLALDGGLQAPAASWRWKKPHLALGGVVLGSSPAPRRRAVAAKAVG